MVSCTRHGGVRSASVGTGKTVTVSGLTLAGADAGNYTLATHDGDDDGGDHRADRDADGDGGEQGVRRDDERDAHELHARAAWSAATS